VIFLLTAAIVDRFATLFFAAGSPFPVHGDSAHQRAWEVCIGLNFTYNAPRDCFRLELRLRLRVTIRLRIRFTNRVSVGIIVMFSDMCYIN